MRSSAKQSKRHAGDVFLSSPDYATWTMDSEDWKAAQKYEDLQAAKRRRGVNSKREGYVGQGAFGSVFADSPGLVRKEITRTRPEDVELEANMQALAAEAGIAPAIDAFETRVNGDPAMQAIVMRDVRDNFEPVDARLKLPPQVALDVAKQQGMMALKGMDMQDRHPGNIFTNKMTGRPTNIDFGSSWPVEGEDQVQALVSATRQGFSAAGLPDVAEIVMDTAFDYLNGGQVAEAMSFTKEAFANLQKIKRPIS